MKGTVRLTTVDGIPLRVHWSFPLLLVLVVVLYAGGGVHGILDGLLWILAIFLSVTIHELTHCVVARHRGLVVRDIVLLPIGGVSEIPGIESASADELVIAAAGPISNFVLAAGLAGAGVIAHQSMWPPTLFAGNWTARLVWANVLLGGFNLLPALPMDGGRVVHSYLVQRWGELQGTIAAVQLARVVAMLMIVGGLFADIWVMLIGFFVLLAASGEQLQARRRASLAGTKVHQLMVRQSPVQASATLKQLRFEPSLHHADALAVSDGTSYVGLVEVAEIVGQAVDQPLGDLADRHAPLLDEDMELYPEAMAVMDRSGHRALAVAHGGVVTGILYAASLERVMQRAEPQAVQSWQ